MSGTTRASPAGDPATAFRAAEDRVFARFGLDVERRHVDVPSLGGRARVLVTGEGPPVLLLIGVGPPTAFWAPLVAHLRGFRLYLVDPPGMGGTDPIRYETATLRSTIVTFLDEVCAALGLGEVPVVAQSVGGQWAIWLALDRPARVASLVLIACPAGFLGNAAPLVLRLLATPVLGALLLKAMPPSPAQVDRMAKLANERLDDVPELRDLWLALERLPGATAAFRSLVRANEGLLGPRREVAVTADHLAALCQPVTLIWGDADPFGGAELGARAARVIRNAALHVVPGGHAPWLDSAPAIAALTRQALGEGTPAPARRSRESADGPGESGRTSV